MGPGHENGHITQGRGYNAGDSPIQVEDHNHNDRVKPPIEANELNDNLR